MPKTDPERVDFAEGYGDQPPRGAADDREHLAFLRALARSGTVSHELATAASVVWFSALAQTNDTAAVPVATADDGGPIGFNWDDRDRHLEAEIVAPESVEWFYRNRVTGEVLEHDGRPGDLLPPAWVALLESFATPSGSSR